MYWLRNRYKTELEECSSSNPKMEMEERMRSLGWETDDARGAQLKATVFTKCPEKVPFQLTAEGSWVLGELVTTRVRSRDPSQFLDSLGGGPQVTYRANFLHTAGFLFFIYFILLINFNNLVFVNNYYSNSLIN